MNTYTRSHLSDQTLTHSLPAHLARERGATADFLADLGEFDARRLFLAAGYSSAYDYCAGALGLTREAAYKRIRAARTARDFPALYDAVADGRLHLSGIVLLASRLTPQNVEELLAAAACKSKSEIERLLAWRFPDQPHGPHALSPATGQLSPGTVELSGSADPQLSPGTVEEAAGPPAAAPGLAMTPPPGDRLRVTIEDSPLEKLRYAQALFGHQAWSRDVAQVIDRALDALIREGEKRRFAATDRPRRGRSRQSSNSRYIPAEVRRVVRERDGGRCTFVSASGHRCASRMRLEYDHAREVALGGLATADNLRLRCRAHNQYGAERTFGAEFMRRKREDARRAAVERRARADEEREHGESAGAACAVRAATESHADAAADRRAPERVDDRDVVPWLRALGHRAGDAQRAADYCERIPDAPIEERVKMALRYLTPAHRLPRAPLAATA